ncbi:energy transducer TonB [Variovorax sp. J22P168]|uniref:energy transducer TonB n=1 Tax=Variovorax jilinensis TaxID=3053513 RepID=UPI002575667C|nr:energy transducer TonB [Variovorax sp. J22P168]MDM0011255.1 energy transducer TonB [Variovorax sp. J22P168]
MARPAAPRSSLTPASVRLRPARLVLPLLAALFVAACASNAPVVGPGETADWKPATPNLPAPYPSESKMNNEQGTVLLRVLTGADGRPTRVEVQKSSGFVRLDQAAVEAVRRWQFKPLPQDGTVTWREVPISFRLGAVNAEMK